MEFENDNHIVEEQVETPEQLESTDIETPETPENNEPATTQDDYFTVKYNKEEKKISRDEAPTYIQKGLNYDKVKERADQLEQTASYLDRVAKFSGYQTVDEFIQAVEQAEKAEQADREAKRLGIDANQYQEFIAPVNDELSTVKKQLEDMQRERQMQQIDREVNELRSKYQDFSTYEERVFNTAIEKGYSLEDSYKLVTYEDRINQVARQKEQEVLAQVTGRDGKQVLASNDQPGNTNFDPENMSLTDIEKLSERVKRGERITF